MTIKIEADLHTCMGAGQCVMHAPHLFAQDEDTGLVVVLKSEVSQDELEAADAAERSCPVRAIRLARQEA